MKPYRVSQVGNRALHGLGLTQTMHTLRHRFGTRLYQETKDIQLVRYAMGHASVATTQVYAQWDQSRLAGAVAAI